MWDDSSGWREIRGRKEPAVGGKWVEGESPVGKGPWWLGRSLRWEVPRRRRWDGG